VHSRKCGLGRTGVEAPFFRRVWRTQLDGNGVQSDYRPLLYSAKESVDSGPIILKSTYTWGYDATKGSQASNLFQKGAGGCC